MVGEVFFCCSSNELKWLPAIPPSLMLMAESSSLAPVLMKSELSLLASFWSWASDLQLHYLHWVFMETKSNINWPTILDDKNLEWMGRRKSIEGAISLKYLFSSASNREWLLYASINCLAFEVILGEKSGLDGQDVRRRYMQTQIKRFWNAL